MFNSISGTITAKLPAALYIENNGLEWDLTVPTFSVDAFGPVGSQAKVFTWLYHREDQMRMYGFGSARERELFFDLMKVEGIGPKQAVRILSSIPVAELEAALDTEDLGKLESAPGIGKKTAQKMILALKGKLTHESASSRRSEPVSKHEDIIAALAGMGFDRKNSGETVEKIAVEIEGELNAEKKESSPADFEKELFRRAIVALSH